MNILYDANDANISERYMKLASWIILHKAWFLALYPFLPSFSLKKEQCCISSKVQFVFLRISFKKNFLLFLFRSFIINHVRHNRVSIALKTIPSSKCNMPTPLAHSGSLRPFSNKTIRTSYPCPRAIVLSGNR